MIYQINACINFHNFVYKICGFQVFHFRDVILYEILLKIRSNHKLTTRGLKSRPMTLAEKHQLRRLIEKLPPKNLDRVVEIIQRGKPPEKRSSHDIDVELQHEVIQHVFCLVEHQIFILYYDLTRILCLLP